jgi:hypothetical protein
MRRRLRRPKVVRCRRCKHKIKVKAKGPLPLYCSHTCRQLAYERRRYLGMREMLAQDIASAKIRDVIRAELWAVLRQIGLVPEKMPPPPRLKPEPKHRPNLKLVETSDETSTEGKPE